MTPPGYTDLLPPDLAYPTPFQPGTFLFDWRTYLSTIFSQMHKIAHTTTPITHRPTPTRTSPQTASDIDASLALAPHHNYKLLGTLMEAAETNEIGIDGRLHEIRQQRRGLLTAKCAEMKRRGRPHAGCVYVGEPPDTSLTQQVHLSQRYKVRDQQHVAEKLLKYQEGAAAMKKLWNL